LEGKSLIRWAGGGGWGKKGVALINKS